MYALGEYYENFWFCTADEDLSYYPAWIPHDFFELVNKQPSRFWTLKLGDNIEKENLLWLLNFEVMMLIFIIDLLKVKNQKSIYLKNIKKA